MLFLNKVKENCKICKTEKISDLNILISLKIILQYHLQIKLLIVN